MILRDINIKSFINEMLVFYSSHSSSELLLQAVRLYLTAECFSGLLPTEKNSLVFLEQKSASVIVIVTLLFLNKNSKYPNQNCKKYKRVYLAFQE